MKSSILFSFSATKIMQLTQFKTNTLLCRHFRMFLSRHVFFSITSPISVYLCSYIYLPICLSVSLSIYQSVCLYSYLSICLPIYLYHLSTYLATYPICLSLKVKLSWQQISPCESFFVFINLAGNHDRMKTGQQEMNYALSLVYYKGLQRARVSVCEREGERTA